MQTYVFGVDDDSVMDKLINELDISSAIDRLMRVGFIHQKQPSPNVYQFTRTSVIGTETLLLTVDKHNHFIVKLMNNHDDEEYSGTISSWDQWIDFVRMLIMRWILLIKDRKALPEESSRKAE